MKNTNTKKTTNTKTTEEIKAMYADAEKAVYIALRARHSKNGLAFLEDLQKAQYNDIKCRNNTDIVEEIDQLENREKDLIQEITELLKLKAHTDRQSTSIKNSVKIRQAYAEQSRATDRTLSHLKNQLTQLRTNINTLYDVISINLSDRADLTQTALLTMLQLEKEPAEITQTILEQFGADAEEELTDEELEQAQANANFRAIINAVGKAISIMATPDGLNSTRTKLEKITLAEYKQLLDKYGQTDENGQTTLDGIKIPHTAKRARLSDCYVTVEERNTKRQQGIYKVYHYRTIAPYQYIEDLTPTDENGESDAEYLKTYNPFISNYADIERLEELAERSNLTDRQRQFIEHFARRCRYSADFKDCKSYAFSVIGIKSDRTQRDFMQKLKAALVSR